MPATTAFKIDPCAPIPISQLSLREEHVHAASYLQHAAQAIRNRYSDLHVEAYFATLHGEFKPIAVESMVNR